MFPQEADLVAAKFPGPSEGTRSVFFERLAPGTNSVLLKFRHGFGSGKSSKVHFPQLGVVKKLTGFARRSRVE